MNNPFTSCQLTLTALSPLHVGGVQEKHLKNGIDFFVENGAIKILKWDELLHKVNETEVDELCNSLIACDNQKLKQTAQRKGLIYSPGLSGNPTDIKTFTRNGLNQPFLPGSSVKGAISSILLNHLMSSEQKAKNQKPPQDFESSVLGGFSERITHFIGISDMPIPHKSLQFYLTKIFSLTHSFQKGGWKHRRNNETNTSFNDTAFVTAYECISLNTELSLRLNVYDGLGEFLEKHNKNNPLKKLTTQKNTDWCDILFDIINKHTRNYLDKEIKYFERYKVKETQYIIQSLNKIKKEIPTDNSSCVFRMASGSGFFSITGDWMFEDHLYTILHPVEVEVKGKIRKIWYKTRRLAFEKKGSQYTFYPMGFVKLSKSSGNKRANQQSAAQERISVPSSSSLPTPQYHTGKIKPYTVVQGICVGKDEINPHIKKIKLFIGEPGQEPVVNLRYPADLDPSRLLKITITGIQANKITTIQFAGFVN